MESGEGTFANGIEIAQVSLAFGIHHNAAAGVMGGRNYGNRCGGDIYTKV